MKNILWSFALVALMFGFAFTIGCSKQDSQGEAASPAADEAAPPAGEEASGDEAAPAEEAAEEAPAEEAAEPAAEAGDQEYTFEALCKKVVEETKAANQYFTDDLAKQTLDGCMAGAAAYQSSPKATEAMAAFTKVVFDACSGKSGEEWVQCYANQGPAAGEAAAKAMTQ